MERTRDAALVAFLFLASGCAAPAPEGSMAPSSTTSPGLHDLGITMHGSLARNGTTWTAFVAIDNEGSHTYSASQGCRGPFSDQILGPDGRVHRKANDVQPACLDKQVAFGPGQSMNATRGWDGQLEDDPVAGPLTWHFLFSAPENQDGPVATLDFRIER